MINEKLGKVTNKPMLAHCQHEVMHAAWEILLDDEVIEAWKHGMVIMCDDGIEHQFYPQIFTYSADIQRHMTCFSLTVIMHLC